MNKNIDTVREIITVASILIKFSREDIVEIGYTDTRDLREHIFECGVAKKFSFTCKCLREVIQHYEQFSRKT